MNRELLLSLLLMSVPACCLKSKRIQGETIRIAEVVAEVEKEVACAMHWNRDLVQAGGNKRKKLPPLFEPIEFEMTISVGVEKSGSSGVNLPVIPVRVSESKKQKSSETIKLKFKAHKYVYDHATHKSWQEKCRKTSKESR